MTASANGATADRMRIVVIVPFLNEEGYLGELLASIDAQTRRPDRLILVDDGSNDGSPDLAAAFVADRDYACLLRRPPRPADRDRLLGGAAVRAFNWAVPRIDCAWDVVAKVDADLRLGPCTIATLADELAGDPRLGMVGAYLDGVAEDAEPGRQRCPEWHVEGATKFYRRACYEQIAPLPDHPGWDTIDEIRAELRGWRVRSVSVPGGNPVHLREMGHHDGLLRAYRRWGACAYGYGEHPLHVLAAAVQRIADRPPVLGAVHYLLGWLLATLRRNPRAEPEVLAYAARNTRKRVLLRMARMGRARRLPVGPSFAERGREPSGASK
jgi:glycosyltransferase involved in cell wall biosynthesis